MFFFHFPATLTGLHPGNAGVSPADVDLSRQR
jgi:hypothetical protein